MHDVARSGYAIGAFLLESVIYIIRYFNLFVMKKIEAIIRKTKFEEVKEALLAADINWFEYHECHGVGQSRQERIYRGVVYSTDNIERMHITVICREQFVDSTIAVFLNAAHTGNIGDGRIFLSEVSDCYSIRTGEHGDIVLRDKK